MTPSALSLLSPLEVAAIVVVCGSIFGHAALAACCDVTKIPWFQTLRRRTLFGGNVEVAWHAAYAVFWVGCGIAVNILTCLLARGAAQPGIQQLYDYLGLGEISHAGTFTLLVFAVILSLTITNRTRRLALGRLGVVTRDSLQTQSLEEGSTIVAKVALQNEDNKIGVAAKAIPRLLVNIVPLLLVPIYVYLYRRNGDILRGCAYLLYERYGSSGVLPYVNSLRGCPDDDSVAKVLHAIDSMPRQSRKDQGTRDRETSCTALIGFIRMWGYFSTRQRIDMCLRVRFANAPATPLAARQRGHRVKLLTTGPKRTAKLFLHDGVETTVFVCETHLPAKYELRVALSRLGRLRRRQVAVRIVASSFVVERDRLRSQSEFQPCGESDKLEFESWKARTNAWPTAWRR